MELVWVLRPSRHGRARAATTTASYPARIDLPWLMSRVHALPEKVTFAAPANGVLFLATSGVREPAMVLRCPDSNVSVHTILTNVDVTGGQVLVKSP
jgi:hypothetical protein